MSQSEMRILIIEWVNNRETQQEGLEMERF